MSVKFNGIYFDFFGTLVDGRHSITSVWSRIAQKLGKEIEPSDPRILQGMQEQNEVAATMSDNYMNFTIVQRKKLNTIVLKAMGINQEASESFVNEEFKQEFSTGKAFRLNPNCRTTIEQIHALNLKIGLISHASPSLCKTVLERFGLLKFFEIFVLTEDTGYNKSQIEIYEIALKAMNANNPEKIVHVGDDLKMDVRMAQKVGMIPIFFNPYNLHEVEDVITITDLSEVLQHLL
ncbi:MAG: HAD-IA family hydrolase [Asgard group archaeon]|nr:HAD-IA family hydrolase [Asgard group archaeon]